jgi:UDP-N-acetylmuramate dehydrogenase
MLKITRGLNLKDFSGMGVGAEGLCNLYEITEKKDLSALFENPEFRVQPYFVIGTGANTVFTSSKTINLLKINLHNIESVHGMISVGAGVDWDTFVLKYMSLGGVGMEALSIIPGTVGAAPIQNIGAYGVEVCEFIDSVEVFNIKTKQFETLENSTCEFSYRNSKFKKNPGKYIVLSVNFKLLTGEENKRKYKNKIIGYKDFVKLFDLNNKIKKQEFVDALSAEEVRGTVIQVRNNKFPKKGEVFNCGSFFANPIIPRGELPKLQEKFPEVPVFAVVGMGDKAGSTDEQVKIPIAYIIEKIGLKGHNADFTNGNFGIHKNHSLIVTSNGKGTVAEFLEFIKSIKQQVYVASGLKIVEEVNLI